MTIETYADVHVIHGYVARNLRMTIEILSHFGSAILHIVIPKSTFFWWINLFETALDVLGNLVKFISLCPHLFVGKQFAVCRGVWLSCEISGTIEIFSKSLDVNESTHLFQSTATPVGGEHDLGSRLVDDLME